MIGNDDSSTDMRASDDMKFPKDETKMIEFGTTSDPALLYHAMCMKYYIPQLP